MTTTDATAPQGITADSPILQFEPSGTMFKTPVTVTFTFKSAKDPVVFWSNSMGGYDMIEGTVTGNSIAAPVTHFSTGFVGDRPMGGSATCSEGVACTAGMTCGYGGTTSAGSPNAGTGATTGSSGGTSTGTSGGSHPPMGGAADASVGAPATDPGSGPTTSALSSSDPGSGSSTSPAICCSCGADGTFHCSTCSGSSPPVVNCVEGAACMPGTGCGGMHTSSAGGPANGGTTTGTSGGSMGGAVDASASPPATDPGSMPKTSALSSSDPGATGGAYCCTCGTDGVLHCDPTCMNNPNAGADASAGGPITGTGGGSDGGTTGGGGPTGQCVQGEPCHPGLMTAPCVNASPSSCSMCMCGQDGTLSCAPCDQKPPPSDDAGMGGTVTGMCADGAACAAGMPACQSFAAGGACQMCQCDPAGGMYKCTPCPGAADGGTGGTMMPPGCMPGGKCAAGDACGNGAQGGACYACQCAQNGVYQCGPCGGAADAGAPMGGPADGGTTPTIPPQQCTQGGPCPQGAVCAGVPANGVCTSCMCAQGGTLSCVQMACAGG
jgi:hypothetical protein